MKKRQRDIHAELFANYVVDGLKRANINQAELARRAKVTPQTISLIVNKTPHGLTGKLLLPQRETVDRIAKALGDPPAKARRAAGYTDEGSGADISETRAAEADCAAELIKSFLTFSPEQQAQIMMIIRTFRPDHPELLDRPRLSVNDSIPDDIPASAPGQVEAEALTYPQSRKRGG